MEILKKVQDDMVKKYGYEREEPKEYDYWLAEVYYDEKTMKPEGRTEPERRHETPEEVVSDLAFMLKYARKDLERWPSVTVTDKSIKDSNPLEPK